jgi:L-2-hydroxyglutarate oxidase
MSEGCYDVCIIGGGIVGMATAMTLSTRFNISLAAFEAENALAAHQTGNNSGVIHSGLYYKPGSLKAELCSRGRKALYRFCEENGVAHERCGKLVTATEERELPLLDELALRGAANGLVGLKMLDAAEMKEYEPNVAGIKGLWVPETGIVDYTAVTNVYADCARERGSVILTNARVLRVERRGAEFVLETTRGDYRCRNLLNTSGLQCDRVARLCGVDPGVKIIPFRGEYYKLSEARKGLVRNLIYPVPDPRFPFLGVHFTRGVEGSIDAGPNAVLALKREGYSKWNVSLRDSLETFTYSGFRKMAFKYWKTGLAEIYRSLSKASFARALARLTPDISVEDLAPGGAGVRAQAVAPDGRLLDDFHIVEAERMIHVLNAPSPAATASMAIGESIAELAEKRFALR